MRGCYDHEWLYGALGYITPGDLLAGRAAAIHEARDRKLEAARAARQEKRHAGPPER